MSYNELASLQRDLVALGCVLTATEPDEHGNWLVTMYHHGSTCQVYRGSALTPKEQVYQEQCRELRDWRDKIQASANAMAELKQDPLVDAQQ